VSARKKYKTIKLANNRLSMVIHFIFFINSITLFALLLTVKNVQTMKIKIVIFFLLSSVSSFAQISYFLNKDSIPTTPALLPHLVQYYKNANEAKWLFYNKKYKEAIVKYKTAFEIAKPQAQHIGDLMQCYFESNQKDSAIKYAEFCLKNFGLDVYRMVKDSSIDSFYSLEIFKKPLSEFYAKDNIIRKVVMIEHYLHNDHFFRSEFANFNLGNEVKNKDEFAFKMALQYDSIYAIPYITDLIKEFNFPNEYDIGYYSVRNIMFLLRHYNIERYVYDSALYNGKILPEDYASLTDYKFNTDWEALIKENKFRPKNNYGPNLKKINDKMIVGELDDIENIDKRREAIGLMPLWQYAKYKKFELSDAYKKVLNKQKIKY
jgi:hypothetical protein